jgi:cbb3-type cytochrome oxidase maturation protein
MSVIVILILASLSIALAFLGAFIWAVRSGQYEDTSTPSMRILADDARQQPPEARPTPFSTTRTSPREGK